MTWKPNCPFDFVTDVNEAVTLVVLVVLVKLAITLGGGVTVMANFCRTTLLYRFASLTVTVIITVPVKRCEGENDKVAVLSGLV